MRIWGYKPIIVIGTGRSGTSIVAKMLIELGVFMGHEYMPADVNNPLGYWEDIDFTKLNYAYADKYISLEHWKHAYKEVIKERETHKPWGYKIPMMLVVFPHILELLPKARYVNCIRNHDDVVKSTMKGLNLDKETAENMINAREEMLKITNNVKRLDVYFDDMLTNPKKVVKQLIRFNRLSPTEEQINSAIAVVRV